MTTKKELEYYERKQILCTVQKGDLVVIRDSSPAWPSMTPGVVLASKVIPDEKHGERRGDSTQLEFGTVGIFVSMWGHDDNYIVTAKGKFIVQDKFLDLLKPSETVSLEIVEKLLKEKE